MIIYANLSICLNPTSLCTSVWNTVLRCYNVFRDYQML